MSHSFTLLEAYLVNMTFIFGEKTEILIYFPTSYNTSNT
uniref:Uncharacterized protein n=1 Tax=Arundo donax TaxID=35708 RepID=A0A0A9ESF5_ARUDO